MIATHPLVGLRQAIIAIRDGAGCNMKVLGCQAPRTEPVALKPIEGNCPFPSIYVPSQTSCPVTPPQLPVKFSIRL